MIEHVVFIFIISLLIVGMLWSDRDSSRVRYKMIYSPYLNEIFDGDDFTGIITIKKGCSVGYTSSNLLTSVEYIDHESKN